MVKAKESCPTQCVTHPRHLLHNLHLLSLKGGVKVCLVFSDPGLCILSLSVELLRILLKSVAKRNVRLRSKP